MPRTRPIAAGAGAATALFQGRRNPWLFRGRRAKLIQYTPPMDARAERPRLFRRRRRRRRNPNTKRPPTLGESRSEHERLSRARGAGAAPAVRRGDDAAVAEKRNDGCDEADDGSECKMRLQTKTRERAPPPTLREQGCAG
eukprot:gene14901-biopygen7891